MTFSQIKELFFKLKKHMERSRFIASVIIFKTIAPVIAKTFTTDIDYLDYFKRAAAVDCEKIQSLWDVNIDSEQLYKHVKVYEERMLKVGEVCKYLIAYNKVLRDLIKSNKLEYSKVLTIIYVLFFSFFRVPAIYLGLRV